MRRGILAVSMGVACLACVGVIGIEDLPRPTSAVEDGGGPDADAAPVPNRCATDQAGETPHKFCVDFEYGLTAGWAGPTQATDLVVIGGRNAVARAMLRSSTFSSGNALLVTGQRRSISLENAYAQIRVGKVSQIDIQMAIQLPTRAATVLSVGSEDTNMALEISGTSFAFRQFYQGSVDVQTAIVPSAETAASLRLRVTFDGQHVGLFVDGAAIANKTFLRRFELKAVESLVRAGIVDVAVPNETELRSTSVVIDELTID